jgi:hypothetical protein
MAKFNKESKEYVSNGHYKINGTDFMSIWTFKKKHNINPNDNNSNGSEGQELNNLCFNIHSSSPDFGGFSTIYIYPVEELESYYGV